MRRSFLLEVKVIKVFFYGLSVTLGLIIYMRMKWSWPDATWQSSYWIIDDINNLMARDFKNVTWFELANREWSLNGWRWFSYINAYFFSWNMANELLFYAFVILGIVFLIGHSIFAKQLKWNYLAVFLVFLIIFVMFSFSGSGARGMELGTYLGIFFSVLLLKFAFSEGRYFLSSFVLPPLIVFIFFGGYAISLTAVLLLLGLVVSRKLGGIHNFPNLSTAMVSCAVSLGLYVAVFLSRVSQDQSTFVSFIDYLRFDALYPVKFLFYAPLGGLITKQNIEILTARDVYILTIGYGVFLTFLFLFSLVYAYSNIRAEMLLPIALILYSIGTSLTIMITRLNGDLGMLSYWYSLHLKLGIVGCLWLLIVFKSNSDLVFFRLDWLISGTALLVTLILIFANVTQWKRQPFERIYFQEVQRAILFPETMIVDPSGLTPLRIGLDDSKKAVNVLSRHKIGIYRDSEKAKNDLFGEASYLPLVGIFQDGWVGPNSSFLFRKGACRLIQFKLSSPAVILQNQVNVIVDGAQTKSFKIDHVPYYLKIEDSYNVSVVEFKFDKSFIPAESGLGPDLRKLSANVSVKCKR